MKLIMMRFVVATFVLFALSETCLAETTPVPAKHLRGNTLYVPGFNLSIDAPGPDWEWSVTDEPIDIGPRGYRTFFCQKHDDRPELFVDVFNPYWGTATQQDIEMFCSGLFQEMAVLGWEVVERRVTPSDVPMPGSWRFKVTALNKTYGSKIYMYGYQVVNGRMFSLKNTTTDDNEPAEFTSFVRSFRFLGALPINNFYKDRLKVLSTAHMIFGFVIVLLLGGIGWFINSLVGRIMFNAWFWAIMILIVDALVVAIFMFPKMIAGLSAEEIAYVFGYFIPGSLLFPFILALWRSLAVSKRREAEKIHAQTIGAAPK